MPPRNGHEDGAQKAPTHSPLKAFPAKSMRRRSSCSAKSTRLVAKAYTIRPSTPTIGRLIMAPPPGRLLRIHQVLLGIIVGSDFLTARRVRGQSGSLQSSAMCRQNKTHPDNDGTSSRCLGREAAGAPTRASLPHQQAAGAQHIERNGADNTLCG